MEDRSNFEGKGWGFIWSDTGHSGPGWYGYWIEYPGEGSEHFETRSEAQAWLASQEECEQ